MSSSSSSSSPQEMNRVTVSPLLLSSIVALIVALLWRTIPSTKLFAAVVVLLALFVTGLAASIVLFVHYYNGRGALRKASTAVGHLSELVKDAKKAPEGALEDLDKMLNKEGLSQLWKDEIQENEKTFKILLTGVTGYVGRAVLFQLLREIRKAEEEGAKILPHKVYVMARG